MNPSSGLPAVAASTDLGVAGYTFADLHDSERLASLYERFCEEVEAADPGFWVEWDAYRKAPDAPRTPLALSNLLIGADLVKPESELLLAYDDPLCVTAAFNRNLLVRINRELGGNFDVDAFGHRAVWNRAESRVEMHLVSLRRQWVRIPCAHVDVTFKEGDTIWTESSYKYEPDELAVLLERAGFRPVEHWLAGEERFLLTLARAE